MNRKIHYLVQLSALVVPFLSRTNPVHFNIILSTPRSSHGATQHNILKFYYLQTSSTLFGLLRQ
jgi:hypothetical protein